MLEIGNYFTNVGVNVTVLQHCFRRAAFDRLPTDLKDTLYRSFRIRSQLATQNFYGGERAAQSLDQLDDAGVERIELSDNERDRWHDALEPLTETYLRAQEAIGLDPRAVVADAQRLAAQYAPMNNADLLRHVAEHPTTGIIDY